MAKNSSLWPYVWLSFYGPFYLCAYILFQSQYHRLHHDSLAASILQAALWIAPLLGIYCFYRISRSPQKTDLIQGLAGIGLLLDLVIPVLITPL